MNIVIVDKKDISLKTTTKQLIIDTQKIPFTLIDTLIIESKISLNSADINRLTSNGISIILLNSRQYLSSIISSPNSKNANLKIAQYKAALEPIVIAKTILKLKISSHIAQLKLHKIELNKSRYIR